LGSIGSSRKITAELLQSQIAAEADPARRAGPERCLETLVSMLEQMAPELKREKQDAADAKARWGRIGGAPALVCSANLLSPQRDVPLFRRRPARRMSAERLERFFLAAGLEVRIHLPPPDSPCLAGYRLLRRKAGLFPRVCGAEQVARSGETGVGR
jgi:hypothetical protein